MSDLFWPVGGGGVPTAGHSAIDKFNMAWQDHWLSGFIIARFRSTVFIHIHTCMKRVAQKVILSRCFPEEVRHAVKLTWLLFLD